MSTRISRRLVIIVCLAVLLTVVLSWQLQASSLTPGGVLSPILPISPLRILRWIPIFLVPVATPAP
ncbi:MAG: hypothetical protein NT169_19440 [Chloroflexi bacterium]|nr:hypothetical protein [Chloroflexota bacterium]